jgi:hypothetical protein
LKIFTEAHDGFKVESGSGVAWTIRLNYSCQQVLVGSWMDWLLLVIKFQYTDMKSVECVEIQLCLLQWKLPESGLHQKLGGPDGR